ncbi:MAG: hypothetical protein KDG50_05920 [Chromatiales bacterium]|nr:hypothetical protein [Chromatiales bacterium]
MPGPGKRYALLWISAVFVLVLSVALLNRIVDPYGVWGGPYRSGINAIKPEQFKLASLFKAAAVMRNRPRQIVLGSSRAEIGIDPRDIGDHAYNLSVAGGHLPSIRAVFDHALDNQPQLERVVLGLDFFMFDRNLAAAEGFEPDRLMRRRIGLVDRARTLLSTDALLASIRTLAVNVSGAAVDNDYDELGMQTFAERRKRLTHTPLPQWFERSLAIYRRRFADFAYDPELFTELDHIISACRAHNVRLDLFISPTHALHQQAIHNAGLWPVYEDWKRRLARRAAVWDFSGFNTITTEPVGVVMQNYWDVSHYRASIGRRVLARMQGDADDGFGRRLDPSATESALAAVRDERSRWVESNPGWTRWFASAAGTPAD